MQPLADLLDEASITQAIRGELTSPPVLLPTGTLESALAANISEVARWAWATVGGPWTPALEQIVAVSKARHAIRPVAIWDLPSRLAYDALADRLRGSLTVPDRSSFAWLEFQTEPNRQYCTYIVTADIASCYQLIDHGELTKELLVQTGESDTIAQIVNLLRETSGRSYGIPQQSAASDLIAEAFLARLERAIVRKGIACTRYNDDFRIISPDWSGVVRSIEVLSEEARNMGLVLNDSKVLTFKKATYAKQLDESRQLRARIAADAEVDLSETYIDYDGEVGVIDPPQGDVEELAAVRLLERWRRIAGRGAVAESNRREHRALVQLLPFALRSLQAVPRDASNAIDIAFRLLSFEQTLTPHVCRFLESRSDEAAVLDGLDVYLKARPYTSGWQAWWLAGVVSRLQGFGQGSHARKRSEWLGGCFDRVSNHQVLRAHVALAQARVGQIGPDALLGLYDRSNGVARPVLVAALALLKPSNAVKSSVTADSKYHSIVFDWAETNG